jgi:hypothetical protein
VELVIEREVLIGNSRELRSESTGETIEASERSTESKER